MRDGRAKRHLKTADGLAVLGPGNRASTNRTVPSGPGAEKMTSLRVLFVCTGNLCRSPMAEAILKGLLARDGEPGIEVDSAGTWAPEGEVIAPMALKVLQDEGLDARDHVSKRIGTELIERSDLIVVMERSHREEILALWPQTAGKVVLISSFGGDRADEDISDPYGKGIKEYRKCFKSLEQLVGALYGQLVRTNRGRDGTLCGGRGE